MGTVKTRDIPTELRTWWKHFQDASYRHDYSRVFDDFLTMTLSQFGPPGMYDDWHADAMKPYDRKEKDSFNAMFFEIFKVFEDQIDKQEKPYYDLFGKMYETLAGNYKKSGLGQFFTPEPVVDMMVQMTLDVKKGEGKRMIDPTCGSGRMLFIAHVHAPGNFQYGIDIDSICCKMTALNMMLHGCRGEVACGDGLMLHKDYRYGLSINPVLQSTGVPSIMKIGSDCSQIFKSYAEYGKQLAEQVQEPKKKKVDSPVQQLTIF